MRARRALTAALGSIGVCRRGCSWNGNLAAAGVVARGLERGRGFGVVFAPTAWPCSVRPVTGALLLSGASVLVEGDAKRKSEQGFSGLHADADLLKAAHHGSATSTIPRPESIRISQSFRWARNTYGRPRGEILARLADAHIPTHLDGAVTPYLDGKTVVPDLSQFKVPRVSLPEFR